MTITAKNTVADAATATVTGKGKSARLAAFASIATQAYGAESSKALFVATLSKALGDTPTDEQTAYARLEATVGITAMRLPVGELPKGCTSTDAKLAFARDLILNKQAPTTAVSGTVRKLSKGKSGWRSAVQHRIIRNAEQRASKYLAELGAGDAMTDKADNAAKAKRATRTASTVSDVVAAKPSHSELVKPEAPVDAAAYVQHMQTQLSALLAYDNKNAKVRPVTHSAFADMLVALRTAGNVAANAFAVMNSEADGKRAVAGK